MQYTYPVLLSEDRDDGGYVVTCRDIPEVITQGDTFNEALEYAADALDVALCGRIDQGGDIPAPTAKKAGEHLVSVPVITALKAAAFAQFQQSGRTRLAIAAELGLPESEIQRILNPGHTTGIDRLESFIHALGGSITLSATGKQVA